MNACDLCHEDTRNRKRNQRGELLCSECRAAAAYYDSLSPADWAAEEEMIARYVERSSL